MQEAIDAPKIRFVKPDIKRADHKPDSFLVESLVEKGHKVKRGSISNANGIRIIYDDDGEISKFESASDSMGREEEVRSSECGVFGLEFLVFGFWLLVIYYEEYYLRVRPIYMWYPHEKQVYAGTHDQYTKL